MTFRFFPQVSHSHFCHPESLIIANWEMIHKVTHSQTPKGQDWQKATQYSPQLSQPQSSQKAYWQFNQVILAVLILWTVSNLPFSKWKELGQAWIYNIIIGKDNISVLVIPEELKILGCSSSVSTQKKADRELRRLDIERYGYFSVSAEWNTSLSLIL